MKRYSAIVIAMVLVGALMAYLFLHGYEDAQAINSELTYAENFVTNIGEDWFKVLAYGVGGVGLVTIIVANFFFILFCK